MKIFVSFLSLIAVAATMDYEIINITSSPGFIYNNIGNVYNSTHLSLNFVTFLNLRSVDNNMRELERAIKRFKELCSIANQSSTNGIKCDIFTKNSEKIDLFKLESDFYKFVGYNNTISDSIHRIYYDENIPDSLIEKQIDLISKKQFLPNESSTKDQSIIYITETMNNNVNDERFSAESIEMHVNETENTYLYNTLGTISKLSDFLDRTFITYHKIFKALNQMMDNLKNHIVVDMIFQLQQLMHELNQARKYLPKGVDLLYNLEEDSIRKLLELSTNTLYYSDGLLVYSMTVLLKNADSKFQLYELNPLPTAIKDAYIYVKPESKFLITDEFLNKYGLINNITACKFDLYRNYFCIMDESWHFKSTNSDVPCEISLLIGRETLTDNCNRRLVRIKTGIWHQMTNKNVWLYIATNDSKINIQCKSQNYDLSVFASTWLLKLFEDCTVRSENKTFMFRPSYSNDGLFEPKFNATTNWCSPFDWSLVTIKATTASIFNELDTSSVDVEKICSQSYYLHLSKFSLFYVTLPVTAIIVLGVLIYILLIFIRSKIHH